VAALKKAFDCCVVGGGPAGVVLGLLLARKSVRVVLLEAHEDFDRDFRGDTVHPSTLEMLDRIDLAEKVLAIDHVKMSQMSLVTGNGAVTLADFSRSGLRFPYIAVLPQDELLELLVSEAKRYPTFEVRMGARASDLIEQAGRVRGVRLSDGSEIRATLTVGADGRGSRVSRLAGFEPVKNAPPMDVMWFRLPRHQDESALEMTGFRVGAGHVIVVFGRKHEWQLGYIITKGTVRQVRDAGLDAFRQSVATLVPELADRVDTVTQWSDVHFLSVESSRLPRWYKPGLLVLGDAAHVMSPAGGVGINYAIQDAVAAANLLWRPLKDGTLSTADLEAVQRRREPPTRFIQRVQSILQRQFIRRALDDEEFTLSWQARLAAKIPLLRRMAAKIIGMGPRPEFVED
jgi:2-polyprenyl-6-methoxyphenol hydroxylase-like FAD-dependent oxidoreductase